MSMMAGCQRHLPRAPQFEIEFIDELCHQQPHVARTLPVSERLGQKPTGQADPTDEADNWAQLHESDEEEEKSDRGAWGPEPEWFFITAVAILDRAETGGLGIHREFSG
jgi:hypothetical protein